MSPQIRIVVLLAIGFAVGIACAIWSIPVLVTTLIAVPLGLFCWYWILYGDVLPPWTFVTSRGRVAMAPVLSGNSNLGSRRHQITMVVEQMIRMLQAIALGYFGAVLLDFAAPIEPMQVLIFVCPMIAWWIIA